MRCVLPLLDLPLPLVLVHDLEPSISDGKSVLHLLDLPLEISIGTGGKIVLHLLDLPLVLAHGLVTSIGTAGKILPS